MAPLRFHIDTYSCSAALMELRRGSSHTKDDGKKKKIMQSGDEWHDLSPHSEDIFLLQRLGHFLQFFGGQGTSRYARGIVHLRKRKNAKMSLNWKCIWIGRPLFRSGGRSSCAVCAKEARLSSPRRSHILWCNDDGGGREGRAMDLIRWGSRLMRAIRGGGTRQRR